MSHEQDSIDAVMMGETGMEVPWEADTGDTGLVKQVIDECLDVLKALIRHRTAAAGMAMIMGLTVVAVFANVLAPHDPNVQDLYHVLEGPSRLHLLGTDDVGRDLLSRVIYGARVSLLVGLVSTAASAFTGVLIGLAAGYKGGALDMIVMRLTDTVMCVPGLIFLLVMAAALGPGIHNIIISITLLGWTSFARITRAQVLALKELQFVEAARAIGASGFRIMFRHLLPNAMAPVIVATSITIGYVIMLESAASFLGLGVQPPTPSWGESLRVGYSHLETAPVFSIAPGLMIMVTVLAFNFLGDGLRDVLDPKLEMIQ